MELSELRARIDIVNDEILKLFLERMDLVEQIGDYKKAHGLPTLDRKREEAILQKVADSTEEEYRSYAIKFFKYIMDLGKEYQDTLR